MECKFVSFIPDDRLPLLHLDFSGIDCVPQMKQFHFLQNRFKNVTLLNEGKKFFESIKNETFDNRNSSNELSYWMR